MGITTAMPNARGRSSRHARWRRNTQDGRLRIMNAVATPLMTKIRSIRQRFTISIGISMSWVV